MLLCFILGVIARFQNTKFYVPIVSWTCCDPLGKGLTTLGLVPICPRRAVAQIHWGFQFMKYSRKPPTRLADLHSCLWSCANEWGSSVLPCQLSCPWRGSASSPKCTPRAETVSPSTIRGIFRPHSLLPGLCLPSPQEHLCAQHAPPL